MGSDRVVHFKVLYAPSVAMALGCYHGMNFQAGCRCCSVNKAVHESIDISWEEDVETGNRIIFGTVDTKDGRLALARLIAFVRNDRDPLDLPGAEKALEKMR